MALTEHHLAAIRAAVEKDAAAVRRADWDTITRMFTADAIRFRPHQPPIRGRAAMRWRRFRHSRSAITADEIVGGDGLAFVRGTYAMTISGPIHELFSWMILTTKLRRPIIHRDRFAERTGEAPAAVCLVR